MSVDQLEFSKASVCSAVFITLPVVHSALALQLLLSVTNTRSDKMPAIYTALRQTSISHYKFSNVQALARQRLYS